jgi:DNA-binding SARP family transcriptional activator/tetratricopeptide (TPR) repeat protein
MARPGAGAAVPVVGPPGRGPAGRAVVQMAVEVRVLGAVEAHVDGRPVDLGHARQRCVLVALLVDADRPVPVDQLLDRVWGDRLPLRARAALYSYLSRLRRVLAAVGGAGIVRQPGGYLLTVDPMAVDLHRFRRLVARARESTDDVAAALLAEALALWRGPAFARLDTPWLNAVRAALDRERLAAELDRNDLALRLGTHAAVLAELSAGAAAYPLDERLAGQLLLALYRSGRQADALAHYQQLRLRLVEELGADPSAPLRRLHRQILTADPALAVPVRAGPSGAERSGAGRSGAGRSGAGRSGAEPSGAGRSSAGRPPVPRQLPASPRSFSGRERELAALSTALAAQPGGRGPVLISAVGGLGGIGKTWLALRWAYDNLDRFPDGQLAVDLRGFDPAGEPMPPTVALRGFLDALGVDPAAIPADPAAQAALYRSAVAGKRMLILLDNARDTAQAAPLLPGSAGCTVLVTSRRQLLGLVTAHGARPLALDVLTEPEARRLLVQHLGADRVAAEPEPVAALLDCCAGLPLALGIIAARAAVRPDRPLGTLAAELRDAATRLDAFDAGELTVNLRAVLACSSRALPPDAARMFHLVGQAPGPDLGLPAAASMAGLAAGRAGHLLRELAHAHLVTEAGPGRYRMHDLVRLHAVEQAHALDSAEHRRAALHRLLDHYLHTAHAAAVLLLPHRDPLALTPVQPGVVPQPLTDQSAALAWFGTELPALLAAVHQAADAGLDLHAWQLAWTLTTFLDRQGRWQEWAATQRVALAAAQRLADPAGQAQASRSLARAYTQLGNYPDADAHLRLAVQLFGELGDRTAQAHTSLDLARVLARQGEFGEALAHTRQTLQLYRAAGNRARQANALNAAGWYHAQLGEHQQALASCEQASPCTRSSGTGTARRTPGTAWATSTIASATTRGRSAATGRPWTCSGRPATATTRPAPSPTSATASTPPTRPAPPGTPGSRLCPFWTNWGMPTRRSSGPSCTTSADQADPTAWPLTSRFKVRRRSAGQGGRCGPPVRGGRHDRRGRRCPAGRIGPGGAGMVDDRTGARRGARARGWLARYGPAEIGATLGAVLAAALAHRLAGPAAAALAGSIGEAIGFYAVIIGRDLRRERATSARPRSVPRTVRDVLVEFGPAELVDTFGARPLAMYLGPVLVGSLTAGILVGKLAADVVFYTLAIIGYELRASLAARPATPGPTEALAGAGGPRSDRTVHSDH